jgi:hypothetical protein
LPPEDCQKIAFEGEAVRSYQAAGIPIEKFQSLERCVSGASDRIKNHRGKNE